MITLEPCRKEHLKELKALYMTAFPKEERAPWWLMKLRANQGRADSLEDLAALISPAAGQIRSQQRPMANSREWRMW